LIVATINPKLCLRNFFEKTVNYLKTIKIHSTEVNNYFNEERSSWIEPSAVLNKMRNRGYAINMLSFIENRSKHLGFHSINLDVSPGNIAAKGLYEKKRGGTFCMKRIII